MYFKKISFFIVSVLTLFSLIGCGYKPTSYYAKNEINGKVYVKLDVNIDSTSNSVLVKDAVNEMVLNQFQAKLTSDKSQADTIIEVSLGNISYSTLESDDQGYAKLYRTTVSVKLKYTNTTTHITKSISTSASHDYAIDADSVITDAKRNESIKIAVQKALNDVFSTIAVQSIKSDTD